MKHKLLTGLVIIACFLAYYYIKYPLALWVFGKDVWNAWPTVIPLSIMLLCAIFFAILALWITKRKVSLTDLGLDPSGIVPGFTTAIIACIPMLVGLFILQKGQFSIDGQTVYRDLVLAGFGEEFIFRSFLFGLLFFVARWGFLPANLFAAMFFGMGHLYQAESVISAVMIFAFTFGASIGFAWFYYAWKSIWMVLFLHGFMDLLWDGFGVETNVTGSLWVNLARFYTLGLAIFLSVRQAKKNGRYDLSKKWFVQKS